MKVKAKEKRRNEMLEKLEKTERLEESKNLCDTEYQERVVEIVITINASWLSERYRVVKESLTRGDVKEWMHGLSVAIREDFAGDDPRVRVVFHRYHGGLGKGEVCFHVEDSYGEVEDVVIDMCVVETMMYPTAEDFLCLDHRFENPENYHWIGNVVETRLGYDTDEKGEVGETKEEEEREKRDEEWRKNYERREKLTNLELYIEDSKMKKRSDDHYSREFGDGWVTHTVHCHRPFFYSAGCSGSENAKYHAYIDVAWKDPFDSPHGQTISMLLDKGFDTLEDAMCWAMHLCEMSERAIRIGERRMEAKYERKAVGSQSAGIRT